MKVQEFTKSETVRFIVLYVLGWAVIVLLLIVLAGLA